jgi:exosortase D (VPLPA-CTERM-specific)
MFSDTSPLGAVGLRPLRSGIVWLLLLLTAPLPLFWYGFVGLSVAWETPEFRFKGVVPVLCFVMFLQVLRTLPDMRTQGPRWPGLALVGGALLLAALGNLVRVNHLVFIAIIVYTAGALICAFGLRRALAFWAPLASLSLMLPIPRFLYAEIHAFLEWLASALALAALYLLRVPVHLEGREIAFSGLTLTLPQATNGLLHFLPLLLFFFLVATFYRGPLWFRLLPLLLAGPVLVLLSAVRLIVVGLVLERGGTETAERFLTLTSGLSFLAGAVLALLLVACLIARLADPATVAFERLDFGFRGLPGQLLRLGLVENSRVLAVAALLATSFSAAFLFAPAWSSAPIEREKLSRFSPEVGGWSGSAMAIDDRTQSSLEADDYLLMDFSHPGQAAPVNVWIAYYYAQGRQQGAIHSPQVCLPADGWNIVQFGEAIIELAEGPLAVNRAVIRRDGSRALVYYWFEGRGSRDTNEVIARMRLRVDGIVKRRTDGALIRFATVFGPDEEVVDAELRLQAMLEEVVPSLSRFVPP